MIGLTTVASRKPGLIGLRVLYHKASKGYPCNLKSCRKKIKRGEIYTDIRQKMWGKFFADERYHIDCVGKWIRFRIKQDEERGRKAGRPAIDLSEEDTLRRRNLIRRISRFKLQIVPAYEKGRPERARILMNYIGNKLLEIEEFDTNYSTKRLTTEISEIVIEHDSEAMTKLGEHMEEGLGQALIRV